jgi:hypothetical protein
MERQFFAGRDPECRRDVCRQLVGRGWLLLQGSDYFRCNQVELVGIAGVTLIYDILVVAPTPPHQFCVGGETPSLLGAHRMQQRAL